MEEIRTYCNNKALQARRSVSPMPNWWSLLCHSNYNKYYSEEKKLKHLKSYNSQTYSITVKNSKVIVLVIFKIHF